MKKQTASSARSQREEEDDNNSREDDRKPPAQEISVPSTQEEDEDCQSSVLTPSIPMMAATPGSAMSPLVNKPIMANDDLIVSSSSVASRSEMMVLAGATAFALIQFLYVVLPTIALIWLAALTLSSGLLSLSVYRRARGQWDQVQRQGLARFLPESLRNMLTQQTLHEWMMDESFGLEYRHLLLYFMPGLTREQLDAYVQRLAPGHRQVLQRPGLGHLMGPNVQRLLVGSETPPSSPVIEEEEEVVTAASSRSSGHSSNPDIQGENDPSAGAPVVEPRQLVRFFGIAPGSHPAEEPISTSRSAPVLPSSNDAEITARTRSAAPPPEDRRRQEYDQEGELLTTAMWDAYLGLMNQLVAPTAVSATVSVVRPVARWVFRLGLGVMGLGTGVGLFHSRLPPTNNRYLPPSRSTTWTITGASASVVLFSRAVLFATRPSQESSKADKKKKDEKNG